MSYLEFVQKEKSDKHGMYVPEIECSYCGNSKKGDSPTISIDECDECEEKDWQSTCCTAEPFGNSFIEEEKTGICSKCYDGANFADLNMEE
tara:strand:- start:294 stop:566 length:273 start_codon:yes stop_codon:yes gene_type:complete